MYFRSMQILLVFCLYSCVNNVLSNSFDHDIDIEHDNGDTFRLRSKGRFANIVDLDEINTIKRLLCRHGVIMIAFKDGSTPPTLSEGQIVLGSAKWQCTHSKDSSHGGGIYARIKQIVYPKENRIDLLTENMGPFDLLDEADIHLEYTSLPDKKSYTPKKHSRKRRYSSNILTNMLNNINWKTNASLSIGSNYNSTSKKENQVFVIDRYMGLKNLLRWDLDDADALEERKNFTQLLTTFFTMKCNSCYGLTKINYVFDLVIYKINNKPVIKKYTSQIEAETHTFIDYQMIFPRETTVSGSRVLWTTPNKELFRLPLAVSTDAKIPPVELVITTNDVTVLKLRGAVAGPSVINVKFHTSGHSTLSQHISSLNTTMDDISTHDWHIKSEKFKPFSTSKLNISTSIFQTIVFNASVHWAGKDVSASLSPPAVFTITPEADISTLQKEFSRTYEGSVKISGEFQFHKAAFVVDAFGIHIWNVLLSNGLHHRLDIHNGNIGKTTYSNCFGDYQLGPPRSIDEVCGPMESIISRNTSSFSRLRYVSGNDIIFLNGINISRCGIADHPCEACFDDRERETPCITRYMSPKLAMAIVRLSRFISSEFKTRKLVVVSSFDEPTAAFPNRRYGASSLHYEGRTATLSITVEDGGNKTGVFLETSSALIKKLGQLAVCSLFSYVRVIEAEHIIQVGTTPDKMDGPTSCDEVSCGIDQNDECVFNSNMEAADTIAGKETCHANADFYNQTDWKQLVGMKITYISRFSLKTSGILYIYKFNDVIFVDEGNSSEWCGHPSRPCASCDVTNMSINFWDVCATRIMSPRLALRLRRLAKLTENIEKLALVQAFVEPTQNDPHDNESEILDLYKEGRAAKIKVSTVNVERVASFAVCVGFDFVRYTDDGVIEVFVKPQDGFFSRDVMFPSGKRLTNIPISTLLDKTEYMLIKGTANETMKPGLLDGNILDTRLSKHYNISDFVCPGYRFFRLDVHLVHCLERASSDLGHRLEVLPNAGYRVRSVNLENIDIRPKEERFRFLLGQAVEVKSSQDKSTKGMIEVGKSLIRACPAVTRLQQRGLGMGCYDDRLYLDIRPLARSHHEKYISIWNSGSKKNAAFYELFAYAYAVLSGGPPILPLNSTAACALPLGLEFRYLNFQIHQPGFCLEGNQREFCASTRSHREKEANDLATRMSSAAGSNNLPRSAIIQNIHACVVDVCGGCSGSGPAWDKKVMNCAKMVHTFISHASRPFQYLHNKTTFYNTENPESSVHSLACHSGNICVENVQLYSLLMPLITSTYRPDKKKSVEERLFSVEDNPSPLLEIVSQELAIRASGTVKVYIDGEMDLSVLRGVLKVLMVFNKKVENVEFWVSGTIPVEQVKASIQRKLEYWAVTSCKQWSRFAVVPYSVKTIPTHRHKRSIKRSSHRNIAKMTVRNWEVDWLSKM